MGYYRLLLAIVVVLSHTALFRGKIDLGQSAVIGFFLISGYVMTLLIEKYYLSYRKIHLFWADRIARIFPHYLLYALLTMVLVTYAHVGNSWTSACNPSFDIRNMAIVPLYFSANVPYGHCTFLPQVWSLALELIFYCVAPFILISLGRYFLLPVAGFSIWVYIQSYLGNINADFNAFRHLQGTLFIFIVGISFAKSGRVWLVYRWGVWIGAVALLVALFFEPKLYVILDNKEILAGIVFGIPLLALARNIRATRPDRFAGNLSYAVYLNHFLLILLMFKAGIAPYTMSHRLLLVVLAAGVGALSFYAIENPILNWRRKFRMAKVCAPAPTLIEGIAD